MMMVRRDDGSDARESNPPTRAQMEDALLRLSAGQRGIFLAIRVDGLDYAAITERTGLTVRQIERRFANALYDLDRNLRDPRRGRWQRWRLWR